MTDEQAIVEAVSGTDFSPSVEQPETQGEDTPSTKEQMEERAALQAAENLAAIVMAGKWYQAEMHKPFWGISGGQPHEFVMRQGGIVSMMHVTDPEAYMEKLVAADAIGALPVPDEGIYAPTKELIEGYIAANPTKN